MTTRLVYGFVAGSGYSGSTLLAIALGSHTRITTIGEMGPATAWAGTGLSCSCGAPIGDCPFLSDVVAATGRPIQVDGGSLRFLRARSSTGQRLLTGHLGHSLLDGARDRIVPLIRRTSIDRTRADTIAFAQSAVALTRAEAFVDATKSRQHLAQLARAEELDLRVLHLVRDPRGFAASARKNAQTGLRRSTRAWVREQESLAHLARRHPELPVHRVRYEDLCAKPDEVVARAHHFLGLEAEPLPTPLRPSDQHIIGNRMRLIPEITIRLDEAWRTTLTDAERGEVESIAWPVAAELGYVR